MDCERCGAVNICIWITILGVLVGVIAIVLHVVHTAKVEPNEDLSNKSQTPYLTPVKATTTTTTTTTTTEPPTTTFLNLAPSDISPYLVTHGPDFYNGTFTQMPTDDIQAWQQSPIFNPAEDKTFIVVHGFNEVPDENWISGIQSALDNGNCESTLIIKHIFVALM